MATIEADLFAYLSTFSGLTALIGAGSSARVWPVNLDQDGQLPAVLYKQVSNPKRYTHDGSSPWVTPRYQLTVVDTTYDGVLGVALQVNEALSGYAGVLQAGGPKVVAKVVNELDDREPTSGRYRRYIDVVLEFQEV